MAESEKPFVRIRRDVLRLVSGIPEGRFTTYGSIAAHLAVNPRIVARSLATLEESESSVIPWFRVVAAEGRLSQGMEADLREEQRRRLTQEGLVINQRGFIVDPDRHFFSVGRSRVVRPAVE